MHKYLDTGDDSDKLLGCATCYSLFLNYTSISYIFLSYLQHHIQSVLDLSRGFFDLDVIDFYLHY